MERPDDWTLTDRLHAPGGKGDPFAAAVRATRMAMLITDPRQPDNVIVFANDSFLRLTGYSRQEIMGRNCRFLQGPDTDPDAVSRIRTAVDNRTDISIDILNYRKDGTPFWNALYLSPVVDEGGELLFFFASQIDATDRKQAEMHALAEHARIEAAVQERTLELENALAKQTELLHEVDHRVKNNLQLVSALIVLEGKASAGKSAPEALRTLKDRLEALGSVHRRLYREGDVSRFDVADFVREYAVEALAGRSGRLTLEVVEAPVAAAFAAPVALIASELVRIGLQAFQASAEAALRFRLAPLPGNAHRLCLTGDEAGPMLAQVAEDSSRTFITMLARQLRAEVRWPAEDGNSICVDIPSHELARGA